MNVHTGQSESLKPALCFEIHLNRRYGPVIKSIKDGHGAALEMFELYYTIHAPRSITHYTLTVNLIWQFEVCTHPVEMVLP